MKMRFQLKLLPLLLVSAVAISCFGNSAASTVEDFYKRVEAGKLESAIELLSSSSRSQLPLDKLKEGLQTATRQIDEKGGIKKIVVVEEKEIGETATVTIEMTFGDGTKETNKNSLIKEGGKWRIQQSGAK